MNKFRYEILALVVLGFVSLAFFWQFYLKGQLPFPGNLLVTYYFPWNGGGFTGFDPWTTRKGVTGMDVIRMMYPWKSLVMNQIFSRQLPLWNPYNFSGTPLLANIQSAVFFPLNIIYLFLPLLPAWIIQVISFPFLWGFFWFLFFRSLKLKFLPSILGAIAAASNTHINVWAEQVVIIQTILFLPLALWAINKHHIRLVPIFLALCILGGHPQTAVFAYTVTFIYLVFHKLPFKKIIIIYLFALGLSAIQLVPTGELYLNSARENPSLREQIKTTVLPWQHLATILAPDYFGNPSNDNFRGKNYDNSVAFPGMVALALALIAVVTDFHNRETRLWSMIAIFGLLFALWPLALLIWASRIPIISTGFLSRQIVFFELGTAVLAALGLEKILDQKVHASNLKVLGLIFSGLIVLAFATLTFSPPDRLVSLRNLVLPMGIFFLTAFVLFVMTRNARKRVILIIGGIILVGLCTFDFAYFFNKYHPFAPAKFVFPQHPVFTFLQQNQDNYRFFGFDRAYIDNNFATYYRVFSPEGYDPLFIGRYGQLLATTDTGELPTSFPTYDAFVQKEDNPNRQRLLDLLGIKYIIDKTDDPQKDFGLDNNYPAPLFNFIKQDYKWKFIQRTTVFPRTFLAGSFEVISKPSEMIKEFYRSDFNPRQTLLLESTPKLIPEIGGIESAEITSYTPNLVTITTRSDRPKLLFLSDNFYPGWHVLVDNLPATLLRADYTFRAVSVPAGQHTVGFMYQPSSIKVGATITFLTLFVLMIIFSYENFIRHNPRL